MNKSIAILLSLIISLSLSDLQAQSKNPTSKGSGNTTTIKKKGKKPVEEKPAIQTVELPYNSNDALFAINLQPDLVYGPTSAPSGAGRLLEIQADGKHPNLFEREHNSVWYKFVVPYNGLLEFNITPTDPKDDYDFLVYKYTDKYFSNNIIQNIVLPVTYNLCAFDTMSKTGEIGMKHDADLKQISANDMGSYVTSLNVYKGEIYYIVLDCKGSKCSGHSIRAEVLLGESVEPLVMFYDTETKKRMEVELTILEVDANNRAIISQPDFKGGRIKFVPSSKYTIYARKKGYFSLHKENFGKEVFMQDTILRFAMNKAEKGTKFQINDIYFEDGLSQLLPESDTTLNDYVLMFTNHPQITFRIKGNIPTYGANPDEDMKVSLDRALSVKEYFVSHGISEERITIAGMTPSDIKKASNATYREKNLIPKIEILITSNPEIEPTKPTRPSKRR